MASYNAGFVNLDTTYRSENTLPIGLISLLEDVTHPQALSTPYDVAFPMEPGTYAMCWKTMRGEDWYEGTYSTSYIVRAALNRPQMGAWVPIIHVSRGSSKPSPRVAGIPCALFSVLVPATSPCLLRDVRGRISRWRWRMTSSTA
jgi:hypothetical protein